MKVFKIVIVAIVSIVVVMLGYWTESLQTRVEEFEKQKTEENVLLSGMNKVAGFSCGILTETVASNLLETDVEQQYSQGPASTIQKESARQEKLFWADSCKYEGVGNNSKYTELHISSFQTSEDAKRAFPDFFALVNEKRELSPQHYGESLTYDGGVHYLLRGNQVIQVAASSGNLTKQEEFSRELLSYVVDRL